MSILFTEIEELLKFKSASATDDKFVRQKKTRNVPILLKMVLLFFKIFRLIHFGYTNRYFYHAKVLTTYFILHVRTDPKFVIYIHVMYNFWRTTIVFVEHFFAPIDTTIFLRCCQITRTLMRTKPVHLKSCVCKSVQQPILNDLL